MRFCEQNLSGNFLTLFSIISCKFGQIMCCRSSEFTENVFFSLGNSDEFRMFASRITASPRTESTRTTVFINHRDQCKITCTKLKLFSGVFQPVGKIKKCRLHSAMLGKKHSVSTWKILESSSGKFKKLNILILFCYACRFKIQKKAEDQIKEILIGEKSNSWRHKVFLHGSCEEYTNH